MSGGKLVVALIAAAAFGVLIAAVLTRREPEPVAANVDPASQQIVDPQWSMRTKGDSTAPITVYEMSDFQCPWCRLFVDSVYPDLTEEYIDTGKLRLIFVNLPIPSLHPNAPAAHEFAMCAAAQDRFWPIHDALFARQSEWEREADPAPVFLDIADASGVDAQALDQCLTDGDMRTLVAADVNMARGARITSTPTFVVGLSGPGGQGGIIPGAQGMEVWRPILDSLMTLADTQN